MNIPYRSCKKLKLRQTAITIIATRLAFSSITVLLSSFPINMVTGRDGAWLELRIGASSLILPRNLSLDSLTAPKYGRFLISAKNSPPPLQSKHGEPSKELVVLYNGYATALLYVVLLLKNRNSATHMPIKRKVRWLVSMEIALIDAYRDYYRILLFLSSGQEKTIASKNRNAFFMDISIPKNNISWHLFCPML